MNIKSKKEGYNVEEYIIPSSLINNYLKLIFCELKHVKWGILFVSTIINLCKLV